MTCDLRTSFLPNLELRKIRSRTLGMGWNNYTSGCNEGAAVEAVAIREQQLKRMQSGSS